MDINQALNQWCSVYARNKLTLRSYRLGVNTFFKFKNYPKGFDTSSIKIDHFSDYMTYLERNYAANSRALYATGVVLFISYLFSENLSDINPEILRYKKRERLQIPKITLPQFPLDDIEKIINYFENCPPQQFEHQDDRLRYYRDRALILILADTGLRIHEACALRRGDIDWAEGRAIITGKGKKQAVVRFSDRSLSALRDYFSVRHELDGKTHKPLSSLPLFARHNKPSRLIVKPITTGTGRVIINTWVNIILGGGAVGTISPHSFRHYFVTVVLRGSGNLKLAQELARHTNIQVTQRYAHLSSDETDKAYNEIFNPK